MLLGLALALATLPLPSIGLLLAGAAAVLVAITYPVAAIGLLAFAVPYSDVISIPIGGFSLTAAEGALGLALLVWLARSALERNFSFRNPAALFLVGVMVAAAAFSAAGALSLGPALKEVVKWLEFGLAMLLAMQLIRTDTERIVAVAAILLAGVSQTIHGISQASAVAGPVGFLLAPGTLRAFGVFDQPNPYAVYLATTLCLTFGLSLALATYRFRQLFSMPGLLLPLAGVLVSAGVYLSYSRSAWLAMAAAVGVMVAVRSRRLALVGAAGIALLGGLIITGGIALLPAALTARFDVFFDMFSLFDARTAVLTSENFAIVHRMAIWQAAWDMFRDHPFLGIGIGNFDLFYPTYALPGWPVLPGHAHNYYLNLLAEQGVVGLAAYLALLGGLAVLVLAALRRITAPAETRWLRQGLVLGALGTLALLTVHHGFDNLYVHGIGIQLGLLLGLAFGAQDNATQQRQNGGH